MSGEGKTNRKLQISNGHYLDFDELARILNVLQEFDGPQPPKMSEVAEGTGLPYRQVRNRVSIARAMGILMPGKLALTPFGQLITDHDLFCEARGTLEVAHYLASSNPANLVWYETFNRLLLDHPPSTYEGWMAYFRQTLDGLYSEHSIQDHGSKEIRFIIEAYVHNRFKRLELLHESQEGLLYRCRKTDFDLKILAAMIYEYGSMRHGELIQIESLVSGEGSPGVSFAIEKDAMNILAENLHRKNWLRYESTHNLDQIRLREDLQPLDFLRAYYEDSDPVPSLREDLL